MWNGLSIQSCFFPGPSGRTLWRARASSASRCTSSSTCQSCSIPPQPPVEGGSTGFEPENVLLLLLQVMKLIFLIYLVSNSCYPLVLLWLLLLGCWVKYCLTILNLANALRMLLRRGQERPVEPVPNLHSRIIQFSKGNFAESFFCLACEVRFSNLPGRVEIYDLSCWHNGFDLSNPW